MYKIKKEFYMGQFVGNMIIRENSDNSITSFGEFPDNTDYQQYLKWLEEGNIPEIEPTPEPEPLTAQQKLEAAGLSIEELKELLGL